MRSVLSACSVLSWALRLASSFVVGVLRLQADALDIDLGQFHRLAGEGAVGGLGLLVRLGLDHAPEILLLEQGHVIGQVVRLEQQAGAIGAVVGRAQFRDLAVLDQALQLGDGAGRTRGGRGRRRRHRRGRRLRVFNLLDRGPGRFGLLGAGASRQTGQGRTNSAMRAVARIKWTFMPTPKNRCGTIAIYCSGSCRARGAPGCRPLRAIPYCAFRRLPPSRPRFHPARRPDAVCASFPTAPCG